MAGLQQVEGAYQRFGSMINTTVLLIGFGGLIWNAGADAEKRDAADRQNAARIELVEQRQIEKWVIHEDLHKNRLADVKAVEARADERLKGIETDVRKLNGVTDNLSYRLTSNEQATNGIAQTVKDIQQSLSQQSGDLREIKVILDRIEKGQRR